MSTYLLVDAIFLIPDLKSHMSLPGAYGVISHRHTKVQRLFKERVLNYMAKADYFMQVRSELADQAFGIVSFANPTLGSRACISPVL
jgi:hypothetical protein